MIRKIGLAALVLVGCAGDGAARDNARLSREIEELRRRTDSDRHAAHELENRVFILEDKLDTANVAHEKSDAMPKLPVVTKKRSAPAVPDPEPMNEPVTQAETEAETQAEPEMEDETERSGPPIVIRLDGTRPSQAAPSRIRGSSVPADLASINEKLPVVPMPRRGAAATAPAPVAPPPAATDGDAMGVYQSAYQALGRREHAVAIKGFRTFLDRWPNHDYADNALYWLGEAYYDQADYQTAVTEFRSLIRRYPTGNKAPDALLKVGFCMSKLGDSAGAHDVLIQVVDIYPKTDAARLATLRLAELSGRQAR